MKKQLIAVCLILFVTATAQQKNSVKVNPLSVLFGGGSDLVSYERAVSKHSSVGLSAGYGTFKIDEYKYNFVGGNAFYRYYTKEALRGLYFSGSAGFGGGRTKYNANKKEMKDSYSAFDLSALIGYQWLFKSGFTIDVNGGVSYLSLDYKEDHQMPKPNNAKANAVLPNLGVGLGYSF
nr:DUF3575 domain-containing protein [uncultured Chryseobacterium sp.]